MIGSPPSIVVTLGSQPGTTGGAPAVARAGAGAGSVTPTERAIRTIDFRRGSDGTGRVIVQLTDPRTPVNVRQEGNQIVVDFAGTQLPKNLMRRYDVMDFATPVQTVDALRVEGSSRLVISAQGDFDQLAYQSDNQYTVEIKPSAKRAAGGADEKKEYTGERLTLNFQDIDVRSVLQLLADMVVEYKPAADSHDLVWQRQTTSVVDDRKVTSLKPRRVARAAGPVDTGRPSTH